MGMKMSMTESRSWRDIQSDVAGRSAAMEQLLSGLFRQGSAGPDAGIGTTSTARPDRRRCGAVVTAALKRNSG